MGSNKKILFVYISPSTFILDDLSILQKHFDVRPLQVSGIKDLPKLIWGITKTDVSFVWFEYAHAAATVFFSKLLRKKTIVVAAGTARFTEYRGEFKELEFRVSNWYNILSLVMSPIFSVRFADKVIANSRYGENAIVRHVPSKNIKTVYHGVSSRKFFTKGKKEDLVITVCFLSRRNVVIKGLKTFIESTKYLPDTKFIVVGNIVDKNVHEELKSISPPNVEFSGKTDDEELLEYMQRSKVYAQLSLYETFGVALAEAMLCECVPVVTKRGAIPEVVGDSGYYVPHDDPETTAAVIKMALKSKKGKDARKRAKKLFPMEKREKGLVGIINEL